MFRLIGLVSCFVLCFAFSAFAFMPTYPDDAEFEKCRIVSSDSTICVKEEGTRVINKVKRQYQTILADRKLIEWTGSLDGAVQFLRDMYDSWYAFRTRLCSLSSVAAKYLEPIYEEKYSCSLYYALHHEDHLNSVIGLLTDKVPDNKVDFTFLQIYDHDEDYDLCLQNKSKDIAQCIDEELARSTQQIKNYYKTLSEDQYVGKWNNSDNLKSGNYRDMFDSWIAYRNRMCSLAVWAYQYHYGEKSIRTNDCIQFYNREKLETLMNLLLAAHSSLDEDVGSDEDEDGGLKEGQTIRPLSKRIDASKGYKEEDLEKAKGDEQQKEAPVADNKAENSGKKIPSWAKK